MAEKKATRQRKRTTLPLLPPETETLNFKVTSEFKREFKGYAVSLGITMVELLKEGFELTKRNRIQE